MIKYLPIFQELFQSDTIIFFLIGLVISAIVGVKLKSRKRLMFCGAAALLVYAVCETLSNFIYSYMAVILLLFVGTAALGSALGSLIFGLLKREKTTLDKNYLCSVIYGIFGSLGATSLVNFIMMTAIDFRRADHPYSYPFCIIAGSLSLMICMIAFCANINFLRTAERKAKIILNEFAVTLLLFIVCIILWNGLWSAISEFLRSVDR